MKSGYVLLAFLLLAGCAGRPTPIPEATGVDGRAYAAACGLCHQVPHPRRHTSAQWRHMLQLMEQRRAEAGLEPTDPEQMARIGAYLERHAR